MQRGVPRPFGSQHNGGYRDDTSFSRLSLGTHTLRWRHARGRRRQCRSSFWLGSARRPARAGRRDVRSYAQGRRVHGGLPLRGSFAHGDILRGTGFADDNEIAAKGCSPHTCSMTSEMTMNMHMLDIMYAPTNWMTLMVMPMGMSQDMTMGAVADEWPWRRT
jgi:hypothetical protein